jgi:hypothetical protein
VYAVNSAPTAVASPSGTSTLVAGIQASCPFQSIISSQTRRGDASKLVRTSKRMAVMDPMLGPGALAILLVLRDAGPVGNDAHAAPSELRLRIPQPARGHQPADRVRHISKAGEMKRPALDEKVERVALMRKQLVRVIDDDGHAVGEWAPDLSVDAKVAGLRDMMTVRTFDARMLRAHRQGKISFYMQALGEEAIACAQQRALRPGDMHFPTYRQQGILIAAGYPIVQMMNQILSNEMDPLKGRQLPVLYSAKSHGYFSISGNLATQYPQAVGWAMASALRGGTEIASAWIGEGRRPRTTSTPRSCSHRRTRRR